MDYYGANSVLPRLQGPTIDPRYDWNSQHAAGETGLEEAMWQMTLQAQDAMERGSGRVPYPERPGEADCVYYMRTGVCSFGTSCRFNHPPNRSLAAAVARNRSEYPERPGQPECQYYLKTGTCKFGTTCKYHHPRYKPGPVDRMLLNVFGYPLRPNEKECSYYVRTGQCKYGITCKFHHPQPVGASALMPGSPFYPSAPSPSIPGPQPYAGGLATWPITRTPLMSSPYLQGPSSYAPLVLPQGMVPVPGWNSYPAQVGPLVSPDGQRPMLGTGLFYGSTHQTDQITSGIQGTFSPYLPQSAALGLQSSSTQREHMFPERPGQPDCQFYMRTGDCKFGTSCRYHHPKERIVPTTNCVLSPIGLPLRSGTPPCSFYAQHGICKFGPTCKFDHPMGTLSYSPSASSLADMPVAPYPVGSSLATLAPSSSSSELRSEGPAGPSKENISTAEAGEALEVATQGTVSSSSVGSTFKQGGQTSLVQKSNQISVPSTGSASQSDIPSSS